MKFVKLIITAAIASQIGACATLFGESTQIINVRASNDQAFEGTINGIQVKAPGVVAIAKRGSQPVKLITNTKGCNPVTHVDRQIAGIFWLNIISGAFLGSGTDYISGKMWEYDADVVIACQD